MRRLLLLLFLVSFSLSAFANQSEYPIITPENVMNLREVETIGQGSLYGSIAWSPDGTQIVTGGARGIFLFDSHYQNTGFIDMGKPVTILRFAPDGSFVFAVFDGKINAFDLETRTTLYQLDSTSILAMSENEQLLAYYGYRSIIVADVARGETRYVLDYDGILSANYNDEYSIYRSGFAYVQFYENDQKLLVHWYSEEDSRDSEYGGLQVLFPGK